MSTKRQHYVPCAYLAQFCIDGAERGREGTIYVYDGQRVRRSQVEREGLERYFYARGAEADAVEAVFGAYEAEYAATLRALQQQDHPLPMQLFSLFCFTILTSVRNASIKLAGEISRPKAVSDAYWTMLSELLELPQIDKCDGEARLSAFLHGWDTKFFDSNGSCIITSDNPVCRWRLPSGTKTALLYLPLNPLTALVFLDRKQLAFTNASLSRTDVSCLNSGVYCQKIRFAYAHIEHIDQMGGDTDKVLDDKLRGTLSPGKMSYTTAVLDPLLSVIRRVD